VGNRRLLVDLDALAANYGVFVAAAGGRAVAAVVKANGYGAGADAAALRLQHAGCRSFFVATVDEALSLRKALGPDPEIFALEGPEAASADALAGSAITPVLNHPGQRQLWRRKQGLPAAVHVDSGMGRLGFDTDVDIADFDGMPLSLLMTHLACADEPAHPQNAIQLRRFAAVVARFPGIRTSIGNSAGCLTEAARQGDLGRPGIGLFGGNPFIDRPNPCRPVAALQGRVLQVKTLPAGASVGYGASCVLERPASVAVVALGYADGVSRHLSGRGSLFLGGGRRPILGRVSMDMTVVDVTGVDGVKPGDWAECFGAQLPIDEAALDADTMAYTLLTGVGARVPREYGPLNAH